jgi:hypothetical protein
MFESLSRSWKLVKASWEVLRADRELLLFPFLSMLGMIAVTIAFIIPLVFSGLLDAIASGGEVNQGQGIFGFIVLFLYYLVSYTVVIFSNTALIGAAMMRLNGENPTVADGFRIARERLGIIIEYAAISATVGMILNAIRNQDNLLTNILAGVLQFAWNVVTFLVIPVLVVEKVGAFDAIKRSGDLLKRTWGEQLVANTGIGLVFTLLSMGVLLVIGVPLFALASATQSGVVVFLAIALIVLALVGLGLFGSALSGIFQAALYKYATEGSGGEYFDETLVENAFKPKRG